MEKLMVFDVLLFALSYSTFPLTGTYELPADCRLSYSVFTCQRSIPKEIPVGIQKVYITDYTDIYIEQGRFVHSSWRSVKQFDITANVEAYLFSKDYVFTGLDNITSLGIHVRRKYIIAEKAFVGLDRVQILDLSNCIFLEPETLIVPLMYGNVLPNLRTLILQNVNTQTGNSNFNVSRSLMYMLKSKNITDLNLRGTNLVIEESVNDISTEVRSIDASNVSFSFTRGFRWFATFPKLIILNMSNPVTRYVSSFRIVNRKSSGLCDIKHPTFRTLEEFYADFYFHNKELYFDNVTVSVSAPCFQRIKVLHIRGNALHFVNATLHLPTNFPLYELDMSSNKMKFLSATFLKDVINLSNLYLADNVLSTMSYHPDFRILFKPFHKLKRLSLAYNQITYIPEDMFFYNVDLEWLDLQGNYLMSTSFMHLQLVNIKYLNISVNKIPYLLADDLMTLKKVIKRNESNIIHVKISDNPFECSCQSIDFLEWINEKFVNGTSQYQCNYETEKIPINAESITKAKFLCIRTAVYIISSVISVVVAVTLFITSLCAWRYFSTKRETTKQNMFLRHFRKGQLHEKYLCLLSYSDSDAGVSHQLYIKLEDILTNITKCKNDIICINDKHFRAGVPIVENQITRCMSESLVAVFVVSEAFCQSNWCCLEVREAFEQQKPIILIFVEEVSEEIMTPYIRNIFQRYTRGKLFKTENGEVDFQPGGIKGLCDSVILLASGARRMFVYTTFV